MSFKRKAIKHIYNPNSSSEMSDNAFIELCDEITQLGGINHKIKVNEKIDGANIKFGKDNDGNVFFMTSNMKNFCYMTDIGIFERFVSTKPHTAEQLNRAKCYDTAMKHLLSSSIFAKIPENTVIESEMLYNDMAEVNGNGLKFVHITYDKSKLGDVMTLIPLGVKTTDKLAHPHESDVLAALYDYDSDGIRVINNHIIGFEVDVLDITQPIADLNSETRAALRSSKQTDIKFQTKLKISKAKRLLSERLLSVNGLNLLGDDSEGIVLNFPSGLTVKVTSNIMKSHMARTAVVAIGNFSGHIGHEELINHTINEANRLGGTPFVFVSSKVGKDDPIDVSTKLTTLRKLFPNITIDDVKPHVKNGVELAGDMFKKIEYELIKGTPSYSNVVIVVGEDRAVDVQRNAARMTTRFQKYPPLQHVTVSAMVTKRSTGISTTALRSILSDEALTIEMKQTAWKSAFNVNTLGDEYIVHLMDIASQNMGLG